jgi:nickel transport protein
MRPGKKQSLLRKTTIAIFIVFTSIVLLMAHRALAHKVNVFAWVEGDTVHVEGYYGGKKKAQNSLVEVFNGAGVKLLEGRTNEKGEFSFEPPEKTELRIVLTSGMGHMNDFIIAASDIGEVESSVSGSPPEPEENKTTVAPASVDPHQLEDLIDEALDRKLAPIIKLIRETRREGPTLTEILGGIGYIFGLFGVALYFGNRKEKERGQRSEVRGQQNADSK